MLLVYAIHHPNLHSVFPNAQPQLSTMDEYIVITTMTRLLVCLLQGCTSHAPLSSQTPPPPLPPPTPLFPFPLSPPIPMMACGREHTQPYQTVMSICNTVCTSHHRTANLWLGIHLTLTSCCCRARGWMQLRLLSGFLVWSLGVWLAAFQQVLLFPSARTCQLHMCGGNGALTYLLANTAH